MINKVICTIITAIFLATPAGWADQTDPTDQTQHRNGSDAMAKADAVSSVKKNSAAKPKPMAPPNRRWIMKQKNLSEKKVRAKQVHSLKWKDTAQEKQCRELDRQLTQSFDRTQFYAIQGDRCKTAQFAEVFLKTSEVCEKKCPEKFMGVKGFSPQVLRNMHQLKAIGAKSCLGKYSAPTLEQIKR